MHSNSTKSSRQSPRPRLTLVCDQCGKTFSIHQSKIKPDGNWCSYACRGKAKTRSAEERFWSHVAKAGPEDCWNWTGAKARADYGTFCVRKGLWVPTHRYSWELHHGPIPDGLFVLHNCPGGDNSLCCNPAHLWLGTQADNMRDKIAKGNQHRGETTASSKLTAAIVASLRLRYRTGGVTLQQLADEVGISRESVGDAVAGRTWRHVE